MKSGNEASHISYVCIAFAKVYQSLSTHSLTPSSPVLLGASAQTTIQPQPPGENTVVRCYHGNMGLPTGHNHGIVAKQSLDEFGSEAVLVVPMPQGAGVAPPTRHDEPVVVEEHAEPSSTLGPGGVRE